MNFTDVTRMMLNSMDFFELRRTAARYTVPYQGVRRQKLIKDIERKLQDKNKAQSLEVKSASKTASSTVAARSPEGAVSAKPSLKNQKAAQKVTTAKINNFSARNNTFSRI